VSVTLLGSSESGPEAARYRCRLSDQPTHLVPTLQLRALREQRAPGTLIVNPTLQMERCRDAPDDFVAPDELMPGPNGAWVRRSSLGLLEPYELESNVAAVLAASEPGQPPAGFIEPQTRELLEWAGILVASRHIDRHDAWRATIDRCRREWQDGAATIRGLISPLQLAELRRYTRWLVRSGRVEKPNTEYPRRSRVVDEPVIGYIHRGLVTSISEIVRREVRPTYSLLECDVEAAETPMHRDPPRCQYTLAIGIDCSPEPSCECPRPLTIELGGAIRQIHHALGEALLFAGHDTLHGRPALGHGRYSASVVFHYVDRTR
jgi:hypothetical protein